MNIKLFLQAIIKFLLGVLIIGILLFIPAGTIEYWNAWLFMGLLFIPMFIVGIIMMIKNPDLLRKRLNAKENEKTQKIVIVISGIMFILGFVCAGLNFRYSWITLPNIVIIISSIVFVIAYISIPLILGSIISFLVFLIYPIIIAKRIKNEEEVLEKNLKGYKEYKNKVKYKMIPFIW